MGLEGGMDQLVLKARFEEAKNKELTAAKSPAPQKKANTGSAPVPVTSSSESSGGSSKQSNHTREEFFEDRRRSKEVFQL